MKTFNLLIACSALALNAMAVEWPEDWTIAGTSWFDGSVIGSVTPKEAQATYLGESYDIYGAYFPDAWELELGEASSIDVFDNRYAVKPNDGEGEWKAGYDDYNLYIFVQYEDDEMPMGTEKVEIAFAPYDKLETSMDFGDYEGLLYARWKELGGYKLTATPSGGMKVMEASGELKTVGDNNSDGIPAFGDAIFMDCTDKISNPNLLQWIIQIPFTALEDTYHGVPFDLDVWKSACNGKGISFDVKFADVDMDGEGGADGRCYWWCSNDNNGFWSTSYSGYLAPGDASIQPGIEDEADADAVSNMTITANQITLNNPVDVKILNASGMLIKSVNDADYVSISELPTGVYIVVAGDESDTFIVR